MNDKDYDFSAPVETVQNKEYLLIGNFKPIVPSNILKCIMQPPISGRDTCPEKLINEITTDYKMLHDETQFTTQAMIGFALDKGLVDFAKKYGDTEAFSDELNNIKAGAQNGRFYVVENMETNQYQTAFYNDVGNAEKKFMKKVKEGSQGVLLKRHVGGKDVEDDEHNEVALEVAKVSKSNWNENDRVSEQLTGIKSGVNSAYSALAKWLMDAKKTYGRPIIDPRAHAFKMKNNSPEDIKKYGLGKQNHDPATSILKRESRPYSSNTRSDALPPNQEVQITPTLVQPAGKNQTTPTLV